MGARLSASTTSRGDLGGWWCAGATHALFCRDTFQAWYCRGTPDARTGGFAAVVAALRSEIDALRPARVVTIGASMGGYAAVRAALALGADELLAFSHMLILGLRRGPS